MSVSDDDTGPNGRDGDDADPPTAQSDPQSLERVKRAIDAATAERLGKGVRRDAHGELIPDPTPDPTTAESDVDEMIERHRADAAAVKQPGSTPAPGTDSDAADRPDDRSR